MGFDPLNGVGRTPSSLVRYLQVDQLQQALGNQTINFVITMPITGRILAVQSTAAITVGLSPGQAILTIGTDGGNVQNRTLDGADFSVSTETIIQDVVGMLAGAVLQKSQRVYVSLRNNSTPAVGNAWNVRCTIQISYEEA